MILHIDMDAFFASIEQAVNPSLKGKPLIVGSRGNKFHTVVCAASYEAKAYGIESGMLTQEAFRLCPGLEFVPAEQGKYIWTSEKILESLKNYGWPISYVSIDEFQMDIPEDAGLPALSRQIQAQIRENFHITASIGIAKNCLLAKLASKLNKPNGIVILAENNLEEVLGKTPLEKLTGVGPKTSVILKELGLETCLDLYQKPAYFFKQSLGQYGLNLYIGLHSTDHFDSQESVVKPKSISHSYTLPSASQNPGFVQAWLRLLSEMLGFRLRQENLASKTIHLWLNGPEMGNFGAQKTFKQATQDGQEIYSKVLKIMPNWQPNMPKIRAIGVTCSNLTEPAYNPLFKEEIRREALLKAMDSITQRFGEGSIQPAATTLTQKFS